MVKFLISTLLIMAYQIAFTQNDNIKTMGDSTAFWGLTKDELFYSSSPNSFTQNYDNPISKNEPVFIHGIYKSTMLYDNELYYGFYHHLDSGYIESDHIEISPEFRSFLIMRKDSGLLVRRVVAKLSALNYYTAELVKIEKLYNGYNKKGLVLTGKEYAFADIGSQFGLTFTFYNGYSKDIKYINFTVRPYNRVGDMMRDDIGRDKSTGQIIGPLKSKTESSVTFNEMFWDDSDVISCLQITYLKITFMDGTIKEITDVYNHLGENIVNSCKK